LQASSSGHVPAPSMPSAATAAQVTSTLQYQVSIPDIGEFSLKGVFYTIPDIQIYKRVYKSFSIYRQNFVLFDLSYTLTFRVDSIR